MTKKIDSLRRYLFRCFTCSSFRCFSCSSTTTTPTAAAGKRLCTALRDDIPTNPTTTTQDPDNDDDHGTETDSVAVTAPVAPSRPSKTMVVGTIFGTRRGHVWICMQTDRISTKPLLLLELSIQTHLLVKEMQWDVVRIALEPADPRSDHGPTIPLRSVPVWTMYCNGKRLGFAKRRKANEQNLSMLKTMQSMSVGAGVIPAGFKCGSGSVSEELMYMRANYEHVVGSADSESFHLINPDQSINQELSVFLMRSK